jgi:aminocarboxymuconate-semialdehyde decarboxylase
MIIDTHAHTVPGTLLEAMRAEPRLFPTVRLNEEGAMPRIDFGQGPGRPIQPRLFDLGQRRNWLKQARVDHQLVGGWTDVYGYDLPPAEGADWARFYNEHMARDAAALPVLSMLATVPLQDGVLAAKVLEEALDAGFHGAMIATQRSPPRARPASSCTRTTSAAMSGSPITTSSTRSGASPTRRSRWRGCCFPAT